MVRKSVWRVREKEAEKEEESGGVFLQNSRMKSRMVKLRGAAYGETGKKCTEKEKKKKGLGRKDNGLGGEWGLWMEINKSWFYWDGIQGGPEGDICTSGKMKRGGEFLENLFTIWKETPFEFVRASLISMTETFAAGDVETAKLQSVEKKYRLEMFISQSKQIQF